MFLSGRFCLFSWKISLYRSSVSSISFACWKRLGFPASDKMIPMCHTSLSGCFFLPHHQPSVLFESGLGYPKESGFPQGYGSWSLLRIGLIDRKYLRLLVSKSKNVNQVIIRTFCLSSWYISHYRSSVSISLQIFRIFLHSLDADVVGNPHRWITDPDELRTGFITETIAKHHITIIKSYQ
jgi:hypothetical protein